MDRVKVKVKLLHLVHAAGVSECSSLWGGRVLILYLGRRRWTD